MTSATRTATSRRSVIAAGAVGSAFVVAAMYTLAGCGGGDSDASGGAATTGQGDAAVASTSPSTPSTADSAAPAATGAADVSASGPSVTAAKSLAGTWLIKKGDKAVALIVTGTTAGLFATGGTVCTGTAGTSAGMSMVYLNCASGSKDRTTGMVSSVNSTKLTVSWSGSVGSETYTKAEDGALPSGLPTAG
ncbi:hypothetical protein OK074_7661 [Actinobacteria bacterium OK074]|nr:hypothetical protein OK074_7661 [Actinobacteria bacterium OK074]